ncbi:MAG: DUF922 domain-containing protein [Nanoarchaeota archaeon]
MKRLIATIIPLSMLITYACGENSPKDPVSIDAGSGGNTAGAGGSTGAGGSGGVTPNCIEDNLGGEIIGGDKTHYFVSGNTLAEVYEDIFDPITGKGFKDSKTGKIHAAKTDCNVDYSFYYDFETYLRIDGGQKPCCCDMWVTKIESDYEAIATIPRWPGCDAKWDSFLEGVVKHEQGHVDLCQDYNRDLVEDLTGTKTPPQCAINCDIAKFVALNYLVNLLDAKLDLITQKYAGLNEDYDQQTNHGETQGAVLNPD